MTDKQPEALRLADHLEQFRSFPDDLAAAAELRRLHTENGALLDERDALAAEVERLKSMTAVMMGVGRGDGNLFVHGDYDSIKVAQSIVFNAERLEKALKDIRSLSSINAGPNPNPFTFIDVLAEIHHIADAALANENSND